MAEAVPDLTQEQLDQLQADPSLLIDHPELEAALDKTMAALPASQTPPAPPVEAAPAPPVAQEAPPVAAPGSPPAPPAESAAPQVPDWLKEIPEASRKTVIEGWLSTMTPQERAALGPVNELLEQVDQTAEQRGAQRAVVRDAAAELETQRSAFIRGLSDPLFDVEAETTALVNSAKGALQDELVYDVDRGLKVPLRRVGIQAIPKSVTDQAGAVESIGDAVDVYMTFFGSTMYQAGVAKGKTDGGAVSEADKIVSKARLRNEVLADLAKEGRVKIEGDIASLINDIPPAVSAGVPAQAATELTDAELQQYHQLVNDGREVPAALEEKVEKALGGILTSR